MSIFQPSVLKNFPLPRGNKIAQRWAIYKKTKRNKFTDKLRMQNLKNDWSALFENDKTEILQIQNQINITDKKIDQMVYKLYDLSDDEIKIVEGVL